MVVRDSGVPRVAAIVAVVGVKIAVAAVDPVRQSRRGRADGLTRVAGEELVLLLLLLMLLLLLLLAFRILGVQLLAATKEWPAAGSAGFVGGA